MSIVFMVVEKSRPKEVIQRHAQGWFCGWGWQKFLWFWSVFSQLLHLDLDFTYLVKVEKFKDFY